MKAWACLVVLLLCTEASAQEVSDKDKRMIYNLYSLTLATELCADDYVFNEDVLTYFFKEARLNVSEDDYKPITEEAISDAHAAIDSVGVDRYCEIFYSKFGGEKYANFMMRK